MATTNYVWRGFNPPFFGGQSNVLSPQYDERLIKNDLLLLIFTVPGERRNRPLYGCPLRTFLFEPANENVANEIRMTLADTIERYEQRVTIEDINVVWMAESKAYVISLTFTINSNPAQPLLIELKFSKTGITNA